MAHLSVIDATEADLPSLSSIITRSFHKSNEYFRDTFPDTPMMRVWWHGIFLEAMQDPSYQVLTIIDPNATSTDSRYAVGILLLHRITPGEKGAEVFTRHPPTADHDQTRYSAMLASGEGPYEKLMSGRPHFVVELFGVDDKYQGTGLGVKLLQYACAISDAAGVETFVQANMYAKAFYERHGFVCLEEVMLPGPDAYGEAFLVYNGENGH